MESSTSFVRLAGGFGPGQMSGRVSLRRAPSRRPHFPRSLHRPRRLPHPRGCASRPGEPAPHRHLEGRGHGDERRGSHDLPLRRRARVGGAPRSCNRRAGPRAIVTPGIAGTPGSGCPPLHKRYEATNVVVTSSAVSFIDPAGHEWHLGLRGGRLVGLVAWKGGGADEPLAEGFAPPGADATPDPPFGRGELRARRRARGAGGGCGRGQAATATDAGRHQKRKFWPAFLGANVVGLGAFYGIKKATDDTSRGGAATCSPRFCVYGGSPIPATATSTSPRARPAARPQTGSPSGAPATTPPCPARPGCPATTTSATTGSAAAPFDTRCPAPGPVLTSRTGARPWTRSVRCRS